MSSDVFCSAGPKDVADLNLRFRFGRFGDLSLPDRSIRQIDSLELLQSSEKNRNEVSKALVGKSPVASFSRSGALRPGADPRRRRRIARRRGGRLRIRLYQTTRPAGRRGSPNFWLTGQHHGLHFPHCLYLGWPC